jgi:hypothetical protein
VKDNSYYKDKNGNSVNLTTLDFKEGNLYIVVGTYKFIVILNKENKTVVKTKEYVLRF